MQFACSKFILTKCNNILITVIYCFLCSYINSQFNNTLVINYSILLTFLHLQHLKVHFVILTKIVVTIIQ